MREPFDTDDLRDALRDERVGRTLHLALRDARLRRQFGELRQSGQTVEQAVLALTGPYEDGEGQPSYLSEERVRGIVYRKRQRRETRGGA